MADRNGYIGRAPSDSSVVVARQLFEPTGITTTFTFAAGYTVGYLDVYLNGARLIEGRDYTASSGSTVDLDFAATSGDVLELVAYKAFNLTTPPYIGIQSAGTLISANAATLNFVGAGNTFAVNGTTVDISIAGGGGGSGVSTAGITTGFIWSNPNIVSTSQTLTNPNHNYAMFGPISVSIGATINVGAGNTFVIV